MLAKFLALREQFQALEAQNADWNVKKAHSKKSRRWRKKRLLVPPAARMNVSRPRGAQPGNSNRFKHGNRSRERQLFLALIRTHIHTGRTLVALAKADPVSLP